ncbi:GGDEF domain-containing protein [Salinicola sp. CR57]|uniref:GGDEF domain-containing protein n=1 Tax=Salinicola sp. CR57 TaxID=1949086 RepID=UPI000DA235F3|nr:GGDEF domain-containing protein [Salinicola sp. CR57]
MRAWMRSVRNRLKQDFVLRVISLLGACETLTLLPFSIYRFTQGSFEKGIFDGISLLLILCIVGYSWYSNDSQRGGLILAATSALFAGITTNVLGLVGVFWSFPMMLTNFFLTDARRALMINVIMSAVMIPILLQFSQPEGIFSFIASSFTANSCAYLYARRSDLQQKTLTRLATYDDMTGARNRRSLDESLAHARDRLIDEGRPSSLILLDLDNFKSVNDRFGHAYGDEVLVRCANLIRRSVRFDDCLFRFGGEEFLLLLADVKEIDAADVAEDLRRVIASQLGDPSCPITTSLGVTGLHSSDDVKRWLKRADDALYEAKGGGRNRAVLKTCEEEINNQSSSNQVNSV